MKKCIEFNGVSKKYEVGEKAFYALDDVSFSIGQHEMVVILGPSGAGKSTLLNIMGGMDHVTDGKVCMSALVRYFLFKGKVVAGYDRTPTPLTEALIAEGAQIHYEENVDLIRDVVKNAKDSTEILNKVGLNGQENKFPNQLSGGEQQRVSIARAIAKNPKLLLCDEPTGALDSNTGVEILKLLRECTKDNTVVIVTHNALIADVADRVIRLKNGKIIENVVNAQPKNINEVNW